MRVPWLAVGLLAGIVAMCLLLPACSDLSGTVQTVVIVASLLSGLIFGIVLDDWHRPRTESK
jgi:hypothetical protein